ncbi:MAG: helix-turn-helix domain-containing protein [Pyrinomonadaceae bacterium]|nr:helix-turn-helix domain-containing protein [Pyrinomonadaceae bacterium]
MDILTIKQITKDDIRDVVQSELERFFESFHSATKQKNVDELGGIDLAISVTGLAKPTIYSKVSRREIPHCKKGKRLYFSRSELTQWIAAGKRRTQSEIASDATEYTQKNSRVTTATNDKSLANQ